MTARTVTLIDTGGYKMTATVRPVARLPGQVHLILSTTLASSKDSSATRKVLDLILDEAGANALATALTEVPVCQ